MRSLSICMSPALILRRAERLSLSGKYPRQWGTRPMVWTIQEYDATIFQKQEEHRQHQKSARLHAQAKELGFQLVPINVVPSESRGPPMVSQVPEHHLADRTTSKRNPVKSKCEALQAAQLSEDGSGWSHEPAAPRERIFHLDPVDSMRHWLRSTGPGYCS